VVGISSEDEQYSVEDFTRVPSRKFVVYRFLRTEPFRQISPRHACLGDV
jgi:LPS O-antigen subunit length determinant protein (WzzB/FepE family)